MYPRSEVISIRGQPSTTAIVRRTQHNGCDSSASLMSGLRAAEFTESSAPFVGGNAKLGRNKQILLEAHYLFPIPLMVAFWFGRLQLVDFVLRSHREISILYWSNDFFESTLKTKPILIGERTLLLRGQQVLSLLPVTLQLSQRLRCVRVKLAFLCSLQEHLTPQDEIQMSEMNLAFLFSPQEHLTPQDNT